jgi:hypothetical protein
MNEFITQTKQNSIVPVPSSANTTSKLPQLAKSEKRMKETYLGQSDLVRFPVHKIQ